MGTNQERGKITAKSVETGPETTAAPEATAALQQPADGCSEEAMGAVDNDDAASGEGQEMRAIEENPRLDAQVRSHLGRLVRASYTKLVEEPVPDRFIDLLEQLERAETSN